MTISKLNDLYLRGIITACEAATRLLEMPTETVSVGICSLDPDVSRAVKEWLSRAPETDEGWDRMRAFTIGIGEVRLDREMIKKNARVLRDHYLQEGTAS